MQMNFPVEINLSEVDRALLTRVAEGLENLAGVIGPVEIPIDQLAAALANAELGIMPEAPAEEAPQKEEPAPEPTPEPEPVPTVDRAEVRQKIVKLSAAGKKAEVKAIVNEYAATVSDIPEDKLAEVLNKLNALED